MDIYGGKLPSSITANDLRGVFEPFGRVETADVVRRRHGDESGEFALTHGIEVTCYGPANSLNDGRSISSSPGSASRPCDRLLSGRRGAGAGGGFGCT